MKKVTFCKSGYEMDLKVAEDCVVIAGNFCPSIIDFNELIQEVKATGKTKLVIVGECHESDHHIPVYGEWVVEQLTAAGIECKWLAGESNQIHDVMPDFCETGINTFAEAESFGKLRSLLCKMADKFYDVRYKVYSETELLKKYPTIASVKSIESHDHNDQWKLGNGVKAFNALFGTRPNRLVSEVNAAVLFNLDSKTGVIVTKSQNFEFTFAHPEEFDARIFRGISEKEYERKGYTWEGFGSIRVNVGKGSPELSIYCNPGVWTVKPHPELDTTDLNIHYVPMWQRVEKAK